MTPLPPIARFNDTVQLGLGRWVPAVVADAVASLASQAGKVASPLLRAQATEAHFQLRGAGPQLTEAFLGALRRTLAGGSTDEAPAARPGPAGAALSAFMLIAEDQIDEDIEVARIAQLIEADAEQELRQLAPLCSGLRGHDAVHFDAIALQPVVCARALRSSLSELALDKDVRLLTLQHLGAALSRQLRQAYREQACELEGWGVEPSRYLVRQTSVGSTRATRPAAAVAADAAAAAGAGPAAFTAQGRGATPNGLAQGKTHIAPNGLANPAPQPTSDPPTATLAALGRLVEWAQRQMPAVADEPIAAASAGDGASLAADTVTPLLTFRLDALAATARRPGAAAAPRPLDPARAAQVMARLFQQIEQQAQLPPAVAAMLQRLQGAAQRVSAQQGDLWQSVEHPWWQMLDRLMALGATLEESANPELDIVTQALSQAVAKLEGAQTVDRALCDDAVAEIDQAAATWVQQRGRQLDTEFGAIEQDLERRQTETAIRSQAAADLRAQPVAQPLHRFLVGPWAQAMTETALKFGPDSAELLAQAAMFEQLQAAGRHPVTREERRLLIARARPVLLQAGMAPERVEAELQDLAAVLRRPLPVTEAHAEAIKAFEQETPAAAVPLADRHGVFLTTVPIDMEDAQGPTAATRHCEAWLDGLAPGMRFHMFLQDRWMTTQLSWTSPNRQLFVFHSRHGGRVHSMTRRVLEKLRLAGLAATLHDGQLLAEAMDSLTDLGELGPAV